MSKVAFIGLGNMGGPMALNLMASGHRVSGYDLAEAARSRYQEVGGQVASSLHEAVAGAGVVISMLPAGAQVASLYLGDDGLLSRLPAGTLVIECSTIDVATAQEVAAEAVRQGVEVLDAPVSGGTAGAGAGTLTFMVGGATATLERARPCLNAMGKTVFHAGPAGAGQLAKICNNMLLAVQMAGTAEALALGLDNGLDAGVLSAIMKSSSGGNWVLEHYNPVPGIMPDAPASDQYRGGFAGALMAKDLGLALGTAARSKTAVPLSALVDSLYRLHGRPELDFSSIFQLYTHRDGE